MNREELFDLAEKVGLGFIRHASTRERNKFELFTKLVAEHEREACAMMCEEFDLLHVAEAIRYRSKQ